MPTAFHSNDREESIGYRRNSWMQIADEVISNPERSMWILESLIWWEEWAAWADTLVRMKPFEVARTTFDEWKKKSFEILKIAIAKDQRCQIGFR